MSKQLSDSYQIYIFFTWVKAPFMQANNRWTKIIDEGFTYNNTSKISKYQPHMYKDIIQVFEDELL